MKFTSLAQIVEYVTKSERPVYVRWSANAKRDIKNGRSYNHQTGQAEAGLSVNNLKSSYGLEDTPNEIAQRLFEYQFGGGQPWICLGEEAGQGSDGEPVLANVEFVGDVTEQAIDEAKAALKEEEANKIRRYAKLYDNDIRRISNATGAWPEEIRKVLGV
jgi:hypothetical protein